MRMTHSTTRKRRRGTSALALATLTPLLVALLPPSTAAAATTWTVGPGQSIQAAVNQAASGDTIQILAGTYAEAVCVVGKGLTVQGAGRDATIITRPAVLPTSDCWVPGAPEGSPNEDVSALKFLNPNGPVVVTDLQTQGHPESGIVAWKARGFTVSRTKGVGHPRYGILATADSKNITISNNVEVGVVVNNRSGTAGISIGDSAAANAVVSGNSATNLNLGIFARESRGGTIANNTVSGNCVGILVFDDANTERPNTTGTVIGGDFKVLSNTSTANNRLCFAGRDGSLRVSGVGVSIVNADKVVVSGNTITDHLPTIPPGVTLNFPPAGLSLLRVPAPPVPPGAPTPPDPGPAENVKVIGNTVRNNVPVDILVGTDGGGIQFIGNRCGTSVPASICGA